MSWLCMHQFAFFFHSSIKYLMLELNLAGPLRREGKFWEGERESTGFVFSLFMLFLFFPFLCCFTSSHTEINFIYKHTHVKFNDKQNANQICTSRDQIEPQQRKPIRDALLQLYHHNCAKFSDFLGSRSRQKDSLAHKEPYGVTAVDSIVWSSYRNGKIGLNM